MNKQSVLKLQEAGYIFIRERDIPGKTGRTNYAIMQSKEFGVWTILERFETKAARSRRITELETQKNYLT
ncbi:MAG: hypothetical protein LBE04_03560 [Prevotellaceae bacterium]|jgi:hypothetical protein|nr:hypothetical protein [Prevotellaceae bacterium]